MSKERTCKDDLLSALNMIESDLDAAHKMVQAYEGDAIADSIHAIIHRREGDFGNSIYWWNRVGKSLSTDLAEVYPDSNPVAFVGAARSAGRAHPNVIAVEKSEVDTLYRIVGSLSEQ